MRGTHRKQRGKFAEVATATGLSFAVALSVAGDTGASAQAHAHRPAASVHRPGSTEPEAPRYAVPGSWLEAANFLLTAMSAESGREGVVTHVSTTTIVNKGKTVSNTNEEVVVPLDPYGNTLILQADSNDSHPPTPSTLQNFSVQAENAKGQTLASISANLTDPSEPGSGWGVDRMQLRVHDGKATPYFESVGDGRACEGFNQPACHFVGAAAVRREATAIINQIPALATAIQAEQIPGLTVPPRPPVVV